MAKTSASETLTLEVFRQLRSDIIVGRLEPGSRVGTAQIRERFGVSHGVLREAITRLEARGLLRVEPNRGIYVPQLSLDELRNLTEARVLNESAALRRAAQVGDMHWESDLVAAHHRMARLEADDGSAAPTRNIEFVDAHLEFHLQLVRGCDNPILIDICARLQDSAELYRSWAKATAARQGSRRDVSAEHRGLLDAALAHEKDLLATRFEQHIRRTAATLLDGQHALTR